MGSTQLARAGAAIGALLFALAHLLPLSGFEDTTFFAVRGDSFSASGVSGVHHTIARLYFSFGWIVALLVIAAAVAAVFSAATVRYALSVGALVAGAAFLTTIAAQAFIAARVPVIALGPVGALLVATACLLPAQRRSGQQEPLDTA